MSLTNQDFPLIVERVRAGDEAAAAELVRAFEPEVRRFIRFRLTSPDLRRFLDSLDISQSVFSKFFVEFQEGRIEVESPAQLRGLLLTMARNKLFDRARRERAGKRDSRRVDGNAHREAMDAVDSTLSASSQLAARELLEAVMERLSDEERELLEQRLSGHGWNELAATFGATGDALRKRVTRAVDRVARELGVIAEQG